MYQRKPPLKDCSIVLSTTYQPTLTFISEFISEWLTPSMCHNDFGCTLSPIVRIIRSHRPNGP